MTVVPITPVKTEFVRNLDVLPTHNVEPVNTVLLVNVKLVASAIAAVLPTNTVTKAPEAVRLVAEAMQAVETV